MLALARVPVYIRLFQCVSKAEPKPPYTLSRELTGSTVSHSTGVPGNLLGQVLSHLNLIVGLSVVVLDDQDFGQHLSGLSLTGTHLEVGFFLKAVSPGQAICVLIRGLQNLMFSTGHRRLA